MVLDINAYCHVDIIIMQREGATESHGNDAGREHRISRHETSDKLLDTPAIDIKDRRAGSKTQCDSGWKTLVT